MLQCEGVDVTHRPRLAGCELLHHPNSLDMGFSAVMAAQHPSCKVDAKIKC